MIRYRTGEALRLEEILELLDSSGLAARRPVEDKERIAEMFARSNLILTAREEERLVGLARAVTDFSYCCYLSDVAVRRDYQGKGIGEELIRRTHEAAGGPERVSLILLSAPDVMTYYERLGMVPITTGWMVPRKT